MQVQYLFEEIKESVIRTVMILQLTRGQNFIASVIAPGMLSPDMTEHRGALLSTFICMKRKRNETAIGEGRTPSEKQRLALSSK